MGKFDTKRYQFDVGGREATHIEEMKEKIGANTNGELFDNALTLLAWAIEQIENGRKLASISEDESSYRELAMPSLNKVRKRAREEQTAGALG